MCVCVFPPKAASTMVLDHPPLNFKVYDVLQH